MKLCHPALLCLLVALVRPASAGAALEKVKVGSSPALSSSGIFLAEENGRFRDFGIDAEITIFRNSGAQEMALLASNELDVGGGNISAGLFHAIAEGNGVRIVADKGSIRKNRSYQALIVRADHVASGRYRSPADLKGMTLALTALSGVSQEVALGKLLEREGLSLGDVNLVKLAYPEMNLSLREKHIDATLQLEPYLTQALREGYARLALPGHEIYPDQQSAVLMYSGAFRGKRDLATRFMAAYLLGVRDYEDSLDARGVLNPETAKKIRKYVNVPDAELWRAMIPVGLNPAGYVNLKGIAEDLLWYEKRKHLKKSVAVGEAVDHGFIEAALQRIGKRK